MSINRMQSRQVVLATILGITLVFLLDTITTAKTTIRVYLRNWQPELKWELAMIQEFEKRNPDIAVERIVVGLGEEYWTKLATMRAAGLGPDVLDHTGVGVGVEEEFLDLTPYVKRDWDKIDVNDFFPGARQSSQYQGKWYGLPVASMGTFIFYNKDLFDAVGLPPISADWESPDFTWDKLVDYARKLTRIDGQGRAERLGIELPWAEDQLMIWYAWNWGGDWFDEESYRTARVHGSRLLDPKTIAGYQQVVDLIVNKRTAAGVVPWAKTPTSFPFVNEMVGMWWVGGFTASTLKDLRVPFHWGLAPLPLTPAGRTTMVLTDHWKVAKETKHPEAAWEFVKFITGKESMRAYAETMGFAPGRASAIAPYTLSLAKASGMTPQAIVQALTGSQAHSRPGIAMVGLDDAVRAITPPLIQAFQGKLGVEEALRKGHEALLPTISRYQKESR